MRKYLSLLLLTLPACSSWIEGLRSEEDTSEAAAAQSRAPASNGRALTIDNGSNSTGARLASSAPDPTGPNLSANEFAAQSRQASDRAAQGFRRNADPWDGTGPVNEGSLWNPDAQDNFYFSKNLLHKIGDIVIVKVETDVSEALNTRISALLDKNVNQVIAKEAGKSVGDAVAAKVGKAIGNDNIGKAVGAAAGQRVIASIEEKVKYIDIEEIPVRITENLPRNAFRVEGTRRVNIRNAPYQLKLSGVIRDEDIGGTSTVASSKVFESKMELTR